MGKDFIKKISEEGKGKPVSDFKAELLAMDKEKGTSAKAAAGAGPKPEAEPKIEIEEPKEPGFDPEKELKKIHSGTKEEKIRKLADFKEKLVEQKKGIAEIQKKLFEEVEKNPEASTEKYLKSVQTLTDIFSLSNDQRIALEKGLKTYSRTHQAIKENTKDLKKETGEIDGLKLYEKLFKRKPAGKIEVILRPAMIYIRIENLDDYAFAWQNGAVNRITDEIRKRASISAGCLLKNFKIEGLENAIALENVTNGKFDEVLFDKNTLKHEEQHAFNQIMKQGYDAEQKEIDKKQKQFEEEFGGKNALKKGVAEKYSELESEKADIEIENRIKDEIIAQFNEGISAENVHGSLLNPNTIYRYGFDYKRGDKEKSEFSQEYIDLVENGISAYAELLKAGYSIENTQGLLFVEPLSKWPKVVERITGKEKIVRDKVSEQKVEEDPKEKELMDALASARNEYAKTEYRDRTAMERIRKALGLGLKNNEENHNVASARTAYENSLRALKDYQISKLQNVSPTGEAVRTELKGMVSYYNYVEAKNFYDAKTEAKMDFLAETENKGSVKKTWDKARLKTAQIAEWYNKKVPTYVKTGLIVASFIPGAEAFRLGKRTWGAFMMVAAGGMQIDKLAQFKDKISDSRESSTVVDRVIGAEIDYEYLNNFLDGKIDGLDKKLSQHAMRSGINKFIAFGSAVLLGASVTKGLVDLAQGHGVFASAAEHIPAPPSQVETLKVGAGSNSFWGTIENKLESVEPGVDHEDATNLILHDAAKEYAANQHISVDEAINKLSRIHPGTEFSLAHDSNGWHAHFDDDHIKFMKDIHHGVAPVDNAAIQAETVVPASEDLTDKGMADFHVADAQHSSGVDNVSESSNYQPDAAEAQMDDGSPYDAPQAPQFVPEVPHSEWHVMLAQRGIFDSPDPRINASHLRDSLFGKGGRHFHHWQNQKVTDIMRPGEIRRAFLRGLPKGGVNFNDLVRQFPPGHDDSVKRYLGRIAVVGTRAMRR